MNQLMGIDARKHVIEACKKVIENLAKQKGIEKERLIVRVDKENLEAKPVFGIFDQSTFLSGCSLNEIITAGGGRGLTMILGIEIRNIFKQIFAATLQQFALIDTKRIFVLLYVKQIGSEYVPLIAVYKDEQFMSAIPIGDIVGGAEEKS